jgi:hypothetical protein
MIFRSRAARLDGFAGRVAHGPGDRTGISCLAAHRQSAECDHSGPEQSARGLILTAWGFASVFGPLLIAHMRQATGNCAGGLHGIAGVMALSTIQPLLVRPPRQRGHDC